MLSIDCSHSMNSVSSVMKDMSWSLGLLRYVHDHECIFMYSRRRNARNCQGVVIHMPTCVHSSYRIVCHFRRVIFSWFLWLAMNFLTHKRLIHMHTCTASRPQPTDYLNPQKYYPRKLSAIRYVCVFCSPVYVLESYVYLLSKHLESCQMLQRPLQLMEM